MKEDLKSLAEIFRTFTHVMEKEAKENPVCRHYAPHPFENYKTACYILEVARSCILPRGWCDTFGQQSASQDATAESVGSHTYLMSVMVNMMLRSEVGKKFIKNGFTKDAYTYSEIMEAIRLHDLPENTIGDWLDNGTRDESEKAKLEDDWYKEFKEFYPEREEKFIKMTLCLLEDMRKKDRSTGMMLYMADKTALVIISLAYDWIGHPHTMFIGSTKASERDRQEMAICDWQNAGYRKATEMFTTDIFHIREITQYDETGFFTALLVMCTLIVNNGKWYDWREKDYEYP